MLIFETPEQHSSSRETIHVQRSSRNMSKYLPDFSALLTMYYELYLNFCVFHWFHFITV